MRISFGKMQKNEANLYVFEINIKYYKTIKFILETFKWTTKLLLKLSLAPI